MSYATDSDYLDARADALHELRSARRRNRVANIEWFDAFYKAYVAAFLGGLGLWAAAGWLGDNPVRGSALDAVQNDGPLWLGAFVALTVAIGLRSAGRGGPLAFELADIRHVLMAPVDRRDSLRAAGVRALRHALFVGTTAGAAAGMLATRRLPDPAMWVICGAAFGLAVAMVSFSVGMIASGLRTPSWLCDILALLILAWSGADIALDVATSPVSWIAHIALWPLEFDYLGIAGAVVCLVAAIVAVRTVEGLSIEAGERRSKLVGQLRFAATMQDVRTVMLIQRQLAQQHQRQSPWFRLPKAKQRTVPTNIVYIRRSLNGFLRWPAVRALRLVALVIVAALCTWGAWLGTSPLIVVGGIALWLATLDLLEPLAQDTDHPDRVSGAPIVEGIAHLRHLIVPSLVLFVLLSAAMAPLAFAGPEDVVATLLPLIFPLVALSIGGAALVVTRPPNVGGSDLIPEVASAKLLWRLVVPPALPVLGLLPVPLAREAWLKWHDVEHVASSINLVAAAGLAFATWAILWIRYAESLRTTFTEAGARAVSDPPRTAKS